MNKVQSANELFFYEIIIIIRATVEIEYALLSEIEFISEISFDESKEKKDHTLTSDAGMNQNNAHRKCSSLTLIKFYSHQQMPFLPQFRHFGSIFAPLSYK